MVNQLFVKWNGSKKGSIANNDHLLPCPRKCNILFSVYIIPLMCGALNGCECV